MSTAITGSLGDIGPMKSTILTRRPGDSGNSGRSWGTEMRNILLIVILAAMATGCSVRRFAMNRVADALAKGGSTFESDDDLELVGDALPFGLKVYESLLAENPRHRGLLLAACQGFASYSYVSIHEKADRVAEEDLRQAMPMHARARRLYLRALGYCGRSFDAAYQGLTARLASDPRSAVALMRKKEEVANLYWTAVALGLAISVSKNDTGMLARVPEVEALIGRALELDEGWKDGTLHEFQVTFAGAKPRGSDYAAIDKHYRRAIDLSQGRRAGVHVAYAEASVLPRQNRVDFEGLLKKALDVDPDEHPPSRLLNIMAQQRARWLLERLDLLFGPAPASQEEGVKTQENIQAEEGAKQ